MTRLRISAEALADLDDIWFHIGKDSEINADRFLERLLASATGTLSTAPLAGRTREELAAGLRSFPFEDYLIFYRLAESDVEITRIIHGRRDLGRAFGDGGHSKSS
jgi:toxin ParE1/3/4